MMTATQPHRTTRAILTFHEPDETIKAEDKGLFAGSSQKRAVKEELELLDARVDPGIDRGPGGLDVQGFTYVKHRSALQDSDQWFTGQNIENIYLPEVEKLICEITGARVAISNNGAFRRRLATMQADPSFYRKRGDALDIELAKLPTDKVLVYGKEEGGSLEPARTAHIDYTNEGLRRTARECRRDISAAAAPQLEAERRVKAGENTKVPRYAAYSVWRPVRTIRRDPLAVCDWRSVDKTELAVNEYRALSENNANGEYTMQSWTVLPPKAPKSQKWYWMPEQQPDEVLIVKFADTAAEEDPNIAAGCPHLSPEIPGTEDEEPRLSIEMRVLAFW